MTTSPIRGHHNYVTTEQRAQALDRAVRAIEEHLRAKTPTSGIEVPDLAEAVTTFNADYREIADVAGVSGLAVLQLLSASVERNEDVVQAYQAGLITERRAVEDYREKVIEEQRKEVLRLLAAGRTEYAAAREVGVSRTVARVWAEKKTTNADTKGAS